MILSASRHTDLPQFYPEWLFNRLKYGSFCASTPNKRYNHYKFSPDTTECIVFWTKNPQPFMKYLDELDKMGYKYYFQYTLTPYNTDTERNIGNKRENIKIFKELSNKIGPDKVIWRYDPVILNQQYDIEFHKKSFIQLCKALKGYTNECVISSVKEVSTLSSGMYLRNFSEDEIKFLGAYFSMMGMSFGDMDVKTCSEKFKLNDFGLKSTACISKEKIEQITGLKLNTKKQKGAAPGCNCVASLDMGMINTCIGSCQYCNAGGDKMAKCRANFNRHNPKSELLIGNLKPTDKVKTIVLPSIEVVEQAKLF